MLICASLWTYKILHFVCFLANKLLSTIWNIPDGIATLLTGVFVISSAVIAWKSVQNQISAQESIEKNKILEEKRIIERSLTAELLNYASAILEATSNWNLRNHMNPRGPINNWPSLPHPRVYEAVISRIGVLTEGWPAAATINFYALLIQLNELSENAVARGQLNPNENNSTIASSFQRMASSLSQALDGLNNDYKYPIPEGTDVSLLATPRGIQVNQLNPQPQNLQDLLLAVSGHY
jgi:hypothetical protein